jgi:hypothetical protein
MRLFKPLSAQATGMAATLVTLGMVFGVRVGSAPQAVSASLPVPRVKP